MKIYNYIILFIVLVLGVFLTSCGTERQVVVEKVYQTVQKDSIVYNIKDSIKVIPIERIVNIVPQYDTLILSTSLAEAKAFVDTTLHILKGSIVNKDVFEQHTHQEESFANKIDIVYVKEPVPYKVEVIKTKHPAYEKWLWLIVVASLAYFVIKLKKKIKIF